MGIAGSGEMVEGACSKKNRQGRDEIWSGPKKESVD